MIYPNLIQPPVADDDDIYARMGELMETMGNLEGRIVDLRAVKEALREAEEYSWLGEEDENVLRSVGVTADIICARMRELDEAHAYAEEIYWLWDGMLAWKKV